MTLAFNPKNFDFKNNYDNNEREYLYKAIIRHVQQSGRDAFRQLEDFAQRSKNIMEVKPLKDYISWRVKMTDDNDPTKCSELMKKELLLLKYYTNLLSQLQKDTEHKA